MRAPGVKPGNQVQPAYPIVGNLIVFMRNFHRLPEWALEEALKFRSTFAILMPRLVRARRKERKEDRRRMMNNEETE